MATARSGAASAVLDGRLYVFGGRSASGSLLASAEVFTAGAGWASIASLRRARVDAAAVVSGDRIYLIGGRDDEGAEDNVDVYVPADNRWEGTDNLQQRRDGLAAGSVGGRIYALGGGGTGGAFLASAEVFDGSDWEAYPGWTVSPARALAGAAVAGGAIVVAGGFTSFGPVDAVQRFEPGTAATTLPALPTPRGGLALASNGQAVFAVGGRDGTDARLADVLRLAASGTTWVAVTPLPEPRERAVAVAIGPDLYVAGGTGPFGSVRASMYRLAGGAVAGEGGPAPERAVRLALASPNPTRGTVRLRVDTAGPGRLTVFDALGREVAVLREGEVSPGDVAWDARALSAGVYTALLTMPGGAASVRFVLAR